MLKSTLTLAALFSLFTGWNQSANSIEKALELKEKCTSLDINGTDSRLLPNTLNECTGIKAIHFTNNTFLAIEEGLSMPNVTEANFSGTYLNTWELDQIAKVFPNLKRLSLSSTGLSVIGSSLVGFSQLEALDLSNNSLQLLPADLQFLTNLKSLDLSQNNLQRQIPELGYLWKLETIDISENPQLNVNSTIQLISMNKNLKSLSADYKKALNLEPLVSGNLETLILSGENIKVPKELLLLPKVTQIGFKGVKEISDPDQVLNQAKTLKTLSFEASAIFKDFIIASEVKTVAFKGNNTWLATNIDQLKALDFLTVLDLRETDLSIEQFNLLKTGLGKTEILARNLISASPNEVPEQIVAATKNLNTINSTTSSTLTVENVDFDIPKDAFLTADGQVYKGNVTLEITVYDNALEMAMDGVPMSYDNNGVTETFSSQGMLRFDAIAENGEQLRPNPENLIEVNMPNLQPKTDGDLYYYDEKQNLWKEDTATNGWGGFDMNKTVREMIDSMNKADYTRFVKVQPLQPQFRVKARYKKEKSHLTFHGMGSMRLNTNQQNIFQFPLKDKELIESRRLIIDTIVSKEFIDFIKETSKEIKYNGVGFPRQIIGTSPFWNVHLTFDEKDDNFRLTFNIKDSTFNVPVLPFQSKYTSESIDRSQRDYSEFEIERIAAYTQDSIVLASINSKESSFRKGLGEVLRNRAIAQAKSNPNQLRMNVQMDRMGFTLGVFGLVNCDFFARNLTTNTLSIGETFTDQNGETFDTPPSVRMVYMDSNAYLDQPRSQIRLTQNSKQVGIIILSATKIAVVIIVNNLIKGFRTIDITGKSPEELNRQILQD